MIKRILFTVGAVVMLLGAVPLFACQYCAAGGKTDPKTDSIASKARCLFDPSGTMVSCTLNADSSDCVDDTQAYQTDTCPNSTDTSGGGTGGTGGGTGGSTCSTSGGRWCPPDCMSCGSGGGGVLF